MIKKLKRKDNTLEDFPPGTLFEIGMLEGCAAGLIHAAGDSSNYFYGVTQPIYFKAAETIEGESDTVKLLVGLIEQQQGGMQMVGEGEKEIQPEVKSNYLKSPPGGVPTNPLGFACFTGDFVEQITAPANVVVGDEWCEDLDECDDPTEFPEIDWDDHRNGFELTVEKTGLTEYAEICVNQDGSMSLLSSMAFINSGYKEFMEYDDIELCLNTQTNKIHYKFGDDNEITINWIWDYCDTYINALDIIRAQDIYSIPGNITPYCYQIKKSLEKQKEYPAPLTAGDYMFEDIWAMHEEVHKNLLEKTLNELKPAYLEKMKALEKKL